MAGHSHWAGIKHKKSAIDSKRGKLWSKLSKAIIVAARAGGSDVSMNLALRYAINDAKSVSMPKDNIERAIKKGTGEIEGGNLEEVIYEGYGPGGVAVLCDILTDNRNRTAPEVRKIFEIAGGKLGATGCVAWMFDRKGLIVIEKSQTDEEALLEIALEAGADDVITEENRFEVLCDVDAFSSVCNAIDAAQLTTEVREIARIPSETIDLDIQIAKKVLIMMEKLDDHDDVQNVAANFNLSKETLALLEEA